MVLAGCLAIGMGLTARARAVVGRKRVFCLDLKFDLRGKIHEIVKKKRMEAHKCGS